MRGICAHDRNAQFKINQHVVQLLEGYANRQVTVHAGGSNSTYTNIMTEMKSVL